jgi:quinol monooxygenase YgiN
MSITALFAEFLVKPGAELQVAELMLELTARVREEPGNLAFVPYTRAAEPRRYFVYEVYRDDAAFQAHITADYGARFNAQLTDLIEGDASELTWLTPLEG